MNRIIKRGSSRLYEVTKALLLVSSCFMVSNLWAMESDENQTKDGYYTAKLINKTGERVMITVYFSDDLTDLSSSKQFSYIIQKGVTRKIRVQNPKKEVGRILIGIMAGEKSASNTFFNTLGFEEIEVGKTYLITSAELLVPELKELKEVKQ